MEARRRDDWLGRKRVSASAPQLVCLTARYAPRSRGRSPQVGLSRANARDGRLCGKPSPLLFVGDFRDAQQPPAAVGCEICFRPSVGPRPRRPHRRVPCTGSLTPAKSRPDLVHVQAVGESLGEGLSERSGGRLSDARHPQGLRCYLPQQVEQFVGAPDEFGLTDRKSIAEQGKRVGADGSPPTVDRPPGLWHRANARHR